VAWVVAWWVVAWWEVNGSQVKGLGLDESILRACVGKLGLDGF